MSTLLTPEFINAHVQASSPQAVVKVPGCVGCGQLHGGVTAETECLKRSVGLLRKDVGTLMAHIQALENQASDAGLTLPKLLR